MKNLWKYLEEGIKKGEEKVGEFFSGMNNTVNNAINTGKNIVGAIDDGVGNLVTGVTNAAAGNTAPAPSTTPTNTPTASAPSPTPEASAPAPAPSTPSTDGGGTGGGSSASGDPYDDAIAANDAAYDTEIGTIEENYKKTSEMLTENYKKGEQNLVDTRKRAKREADISYQRLMKYLPTMVKRQGLSGLGVSQTAAISASNDHQSALSGIDEAYAQNSSELLQNYNSNMLELETSTSTEKAKLEAEKMKTNAELKLKQGEKAEEVQRQTYAEAAAWIESNSTDLTVEDFTEYLETIRPYVNEQQYNQLLALAETKAAKNKSEADEKTKTETEAAQKEAFETAWALISDDKMTTDFTTYLESIRDKVSPEQYAQLVQRANQVAGENKATATETAQGNMYKIAESHILNDLETIDENEFLTYLAQLEGQVSESQMKTLREIASQQIKKNKNAAAQNAYNLVKNYITGAAQSSITIASDFLPYLADYEDVLTDEQYAELEQLAYDQAKLNKEAADEESEDELKIAQDDAFETAKGLILENNLSTDFTDFLEQYRGRVSDTQFADLEQFAKDQAAKNKNATQTALQEEVLLKLEGLDVEGDFEGALSFLESYKDNIPIDLYEIYKFYFQTKLGIDPKEPPEDTGNGTNEIPYNANQNSPAYDEMTDEQKKQRLIDGKDFLVYNGQNYKLKSPLEDTANEITKNDDFANWLEAEGYDGPFDADIPNGTTVEIKCALDGSNTFDWKDIVGYIAGLPFGVIGALVGGLSQNLNVQTKTLTYYNETWYVSEHMGAFKGDTATGNGSNDNLSYYLPADNGGATGSTTLGASTTFTGGQGGLGNYMI